MSPINWHSKIGQSIPCLFEISITRDRSNLKSWKLFKTRVMRCIWPGCKVFLTVSDWEVRILRDHIDKSGLKQSSSRGKLGVARWRWTVQWPSWVSVRRFLCPGIESCLHSFLRLSCCCITCIALDMIIMKLKQVNAWTDQCQSRSIKKPADSSCWETRADKPLKRFWGVQKHLIWNVA